IAYLLKYQVDDNLEKINKIIQIIFTNMDENFQEYFTLLDELERVSSANNNLVWKLLKGSMDNKVDIWEVIESTKAPLADKEDYVITLLENCNFYEVGLYSGANLIQFIEDDLDINKISSTSDMLKTLSYLKVKF